MCSNVILTLYEKSIIPTLIHNCESWTLNKTEETQIDKIAIKALKRLFSLPTTTPSAAILHNFGLLFATQVVNKMQFMYLHKILNRNIDHWTQKILLHLDTLNLGWAKNIRTNLIEYQLEYDWSDIKQKTKGEWKKIVSEAVDKYNKTKLLKHCTTTTNNTTRINTKTKGIHNELQLPEYIRQPKREIANGSKQRAKTLILARHGMLECGTNYKGSIPEICRHCKKRDDENHRLNECSVLNSTNWANSDQKIDYNDIYSDNDAKLTSLIGKLEKIWEFQYANGRMKRK